LSNEYDKLLKDAYNPLKGVKKVIVDDISFETSDDEISKETWQNLF
jgi:hypothetical protein